MINPELITADYIISASLLAMLVICLIAITFSKNLLVSTVLLSIFSLLMALVYLTLSAPDVAITEAAVGAGISSILFLSTLLLVDEKEKESQSSLIMPSIIVVLTTIILFFITSSIPSFGDPLNVIHQHVAPYYLTVSQTEIGIPNVVTSILASYRGFDTLGEVFVIFTAAISILLLLGDDIKKISITSKRKANGK